MAETRTSVAGRPAWVDLSTEDPAAARDFYAKLFGWDIQVTEDPQYGGYALAKVGGQDVAGIGPKQIPDAPNVWAVYIGSDDPEQLVERVNQAGGTVIAPPFDVGDQGRMGVFQDPTGAVVCAWQPRQMGAFHSGAANTFGWAELNARGVDKALPFYEAVFGWSVKKSPMGDGPQYNEFQLDGQSVAGAMEMNEMVPNDVPSHWLVYFAVDDVDRAFSTAKDAGARELLAPMDFPGGRFAVLGDPQGAAFGLLRMSGGGA